MSKKISQIKKSIQNERDLLLDKAIEDKNISYILDQFIDDISSMCHENVSYKDQVIIINNALSSNEVDLEINYRSFMSFIRSRIKIDHKKKSISYKPPLASPVKNTNEVLKHKKISSSSSLMNNFKNSNLTADKKA